jgi:death on curing protein
VKTLTRELVLLLHDEAMRRTGGCPGLLDEHRPQAAIQRPLSGAGDVELFGTACECAAVLAHSIATTHPFVDGNKRTALLCAAAVLRVNGFRLQAEGFESEEALVALATGEMHWREFAAWLGTHAVPLGSARPDP